MKKQLMLISPKKVDLINYLLKYITPIYGTGSKFDFFFSLWKFSFFIRLYFFCWRTAIPKLFWCSYNYFLVILLEIIILYVLIIDKLLNPFNCLLRNNILYFQFIFCLLKIFFIFFAIFCFTILMYFFITNVINDTYFSTFQYTVFFR